MKYQLIPTDTLEIKGIHETDAPMFRGIAHSISIEERDGYWYSKWQVVLHCPSPTGDASDWIQLDIGCLNKQQAIIVAREYASRLGIPLKRVRVQDEQMNYSTLDSEEYNGRLH
jgi:hypothetical protein